MAEHLTVTPSGIEITFEDGLPDPETGKAKRRCYLVNGEKLPSVTTVLGVLDKPGLKYAAEKLAVAGAIELAQEGDLPQNVDGALTRMKSRELRFWQIWDKKAKRGDVAHEDLVSLATGEEPADMDEFAPEERGVIRGVAAVAADLRPEAIATEQMVASVEHGFAGRFDFFGHLHGAGLPKGALVRADLKTTESLPRYKSGAVKPPYDEHLAQLGAYELAAVECGYPPSDFQAVIRVDASGEYDVCISWIGPEVFLAVLGAYKALRGITTSRPKALAA